MIGATANTGLAAYRSAQAGISRPVAPTVSGGEAAGNSSFGSVMGQALGNVVDAGRQADAQSVRAISGEGNVTDLALAVSKAELALQTTVALRDKMVQAYQDIMRMSI